MKRILCAIMLTMFLISAFSFKLDAGRRMIVAAELSTDEYTLALWHFNEGTGQIVADASSHGNNGTLGPTVNVEARDPNWTTGFTGQTGDYALDFVEWLDYVLVPDNPDGSLDLENASQFTIEFWTYVRQISRSDRGDGNHWNDFIGKTQGSATFGWAMGQCIHDTPPPLFYAWFTNSSQLTCIGVDCDPTPTYEWVHVMVTYDGRYARIHYNGVLQGENDVGREYIAANDLPLTIGKNLKSDLPWDDAADAIIDEVRISSVVREPPIIDVAVVDIAPSKAVVGQGLSMDVNVTVENQGEVYSTCNVTTFASETPTYSVIEPTDTTVFVNSTSATGIYVGQTFTADVCVHNVTGLYGFETLLHYQSDILRAASVEPGSFVDYMDFFFDPPPSGIWPDYNETFDRVHIGAIGDFRQPGANGSGVLATVTFEVIGSGSSILSLESVPYGPDFPLNLYWFHTYLIDYDVEEIPCQVIGGQVTVTEKYMIGTQTVTLSIGETRDLTFAWNTTGVPKGNYTIYSHVTPLQDEDDVLDNDFDDGWVIIAKVGDITGPDGWPDGKVDMRDIGKAAVAFGTRPGLPRWDAIADINDDGKVDMKDIGTIARNFGQ